MPKARIVEGLGYGGLLPFLALAVLVWADRERAALWHGYLMDYGAVILSFIGAVHWGLAMLLGDLPAHQRNSLFCWSVVPCLMAFTALLSPPLVSDMLLAAGFLLHLWRDRRLAAIAALPSWYLPLRVRLSAVAVTCVVAGALSMGR